MHSRFRSFVALALMAFPCLLPAASRTWTNRDGRAMEAELVAVDTQNAIFRKADGSTYPYPILKLTDADQAEIKAFHEKNPAAVAAPAPNPVGSLTSEIIGKLVTFNDGQFRPVPRETILGAKYYAVYFSANWCPPCRGFTPSLVTAYAQIKAKHPDFELIFVSHDEDKARMMAYMKEDRMPWPALRFDLIGSTAAIKRYEQSGIPNLVFVNADGKVLSSSFEGENYVGPNKVLDDIKRTLGE